jgi:hypothetical protein
MLQLIRQKFVRFVFLGIVLFAVVLAWHIPLWHDEAWIRAWLLDQTPVGSSSSEVRTVILERGWRLSEDRNDVGAPSWNSGPAVGVARIWCVLGSYRSPVFETTVDAVWAFDQDSRLVDIMVRKTTDAP